MRLDQFVLESLGHASYLVGSEDMGEALVLDPRRDVDVYFEAAWRRGFHIRYAIDTHGHNDYLSGLTELAARDKDVRVLGSAAGDLGYEHRAVKDGEVIEMGEVALEVLHTPGHTPEHVSLLVREGGHDDPALLLSGGALLVGDVARPDLLGGSEQTRDMARALCRTLQEKVLALPDHVEVFPTHVAGSLCGGNIGSRLSTTVGYERRTNELLAQVSSDDVFVQECLSLESLPAVPPYWRRMRTQNLAGVARLGTLREPPALRPDGFRSMMDDGAVVLDARSPEAFGGGHIPGSLNVELGGSFPTWAGTVLPDGARVLLVLDEAGDLWRATWELLRIGYAVPEGWLAGGLRAWATDGGALERTMGITAEELHDRLGQVAVLDVRQPGEWADGHIEGATFITAGELPDRLDDVPTDEPLAVICGSGLRSSVAASLLARERDRHPLHVLGGMTAWRAAGYPTVPGDPLEGRVS